MREILFRGKRTGSGKWVEGSLLVYPDEDCFICCTDSPYPAIMNKYEVDHSTVGQYTGLTDKNGKCIFEEDILRLDSGEEFEWLARIKMEKGCWIAASEGRWDFLETNKKACEVIGNIHDNPELLTGGD